MQSTGLLKLWKLPLSQYTGRPEDDILEEGLLASDFSDSSVHIVFEDGSDLTFRHAFYLGDVDKRRADGTVCRIAVFSEHVGYHEFWIGPDDHIEVVVRKKETLANLLAQCEPSLQRSAEDKAWDNMAPVGREFGSPDYERLVEEDALDLRANLASLIEKCSGAADGSQLDASEIADATNVQKALRELGQKVSIAIAGAVWRHYSQSLLAGWMSGAETVQSAKKTLYFYCGKHSEPNWRK